MNSTGPLPEKVTLLVAEPYLEAIDLNAVSPSPQAETRAEQLVRCTFEVLPGADTLVVGIDGRTEPGIVGRIDGSVAVMVNGRNLSAVGYSTLFLP